MKSKYSLSNRGWADMMLLQAMRFEKDYIMFDEQTPWTPNLYPVVEREPAEPFNDGWFHVALFGAVRPMKSHLSQALAALLFVKQYDLPLALHINVDRVEQKGDNVLKNLRALFKATPGSKLVEHPWMPHDEFIALCSKMDLGLQVSLTETFNIVTADLVSCGVPCVVCPDIGWMPDFCKADPSSVESIVEGMVRVHTYDRTSIASAQRQHLTAWNNDAYQAWKDFLRTY